MASSRTTWAKGTSGNPGGRKRHDIDIEKLAKSHAPEAIETLARALTHPKLCVQAATALLDRAYGRPRQAIVGDTNAPIAIDFRWADATAVGNTIVSTALHPVIEAAVEAEAEPALTWQGDD